MLDFVTLQLYGKYTLHNKPVSTRSTSSYMFRQQLEPGKLERNPTFVSLQVNHSLRYLWLWHKLSSFVIHNKENTNN